MRQFHFGRKKITVVSLGVNVFIYILRVCRLVLLHDTAVLSSLIDQKKVPIAKFITQERNLCIYNIR